VSGVGRAGSPLGEKRSHSAEDPRRQLAQAGINARDLDAGFGDLREMDLTPVDSERGAPSSSRRQSIG
jgi:hypothetical protein